MSRFLCLASAALCLGGTLLTAPPRVCRADWGEPSPAEKRIVEALNSPTEIEFLETPLSAVIDTVADLHEIPIRTDLRTSRT